MTTNSVLNDISFASFQGIGGLLFQNRFAHILQKTVTYVSEHVLPISPVYTCQRVRVLMLQPEMSTSFSNVISYITYLTSSPSPRERIEVRVQELMKRGISISRLTFYFSPRTCVTYVSEHVLTISHIFTPLVRKKVHKMHPEIDFFFQQYKDYWAFDFLMVSRKIFT